MGHLPHDARGRPVPWHLGPAGDGEAMASQLRLDMAKARSLCWTCGQRLGSHLVFTIDARQALSRVSADPPSHLICAAWLAVAYPPPERPKAPEDALPDDGIVALWSTRDCTLVPLDGGGHLFALDRPTAVTWYCHGRAATNEEAARAVAGNIPPLQALAELEGLAAMVDLNEGIKWVMPFLPHYDTWAGDPAAELQDNGPIDAR